MKLPPAPLGIHIDLAISGARDGAHEVEALADKFANIRSKEYASVMLTKGEFPSIFALISGQRGWLTFFRYESDAAFGSRNEEYSGSDDAVIAYELPNGQIDEYPASWAYPVEVVLEALLEFARTGKASERIGWYNESEDGCASPNDPFELPDHLRPNHTIE